jgi:hypothetical protein
MKFTIMMPVEIEVRDPKYLTNLWRMLKDSGGSCYSSDGWEYDLRSDRIKLKDVRGAYRAHNGNGESDASR